MLNEESRKYFKRAMCISSTAFSFYAINKANHTEKIQSCALRNDNNNLIDFLKTANSSTIAKCYPYEHDTIYTTWSASIEKPNAIRPFMTEHPHDIYNSSKAPMMDVMFSFNSKVSFNNFSSIINRNGSGRINLFFQECLTARPDLLRSTEPMLKKNWRETNIELPIENSDKNSRPEVSNILVNR